MGFYLFTYCCVVIFFAAIVYRIYRQLTLPVHVRWEIYPVQHEAADKVSYGGSYMEELNWWDKKRQSSLFNEIRYMTPEILLLRGLWKENKKLWRISFPFHLGLYFLLATFVLLFFNAVLMIASSSATSEGGVLSIVVGGLIVVCGWIGLVAGVVGSLGLLYIRLADKDMRRYATPLDYLNIVFILVFFLCAFLAAAFSDPFFINAKLYLAGLLTGGTLVPAYVPGQDLLGALTIVLASLLAAYIPLTHMSHMFMKYFLYHKVKWDDEPNRAGNAIEAAVIENLQYRPTWLAGHIGADGKTSWKDIASSAPKEIK